MTDTSNVPNEKTKAKHQATAQGQLLAQQQAEAQATQNVTQAPQPRYIRPLPLPRISLAHAAEGPIGNQWVATVPAGTLWEDVMSDEFWANRAKDMKPGDEIRVLHDKWEYTGRLLVQQTRTVGPGMVANRVTVWCETYSDCYLPDPKTDPTDTYTAFEGAFKKWCVLRRNNPVPLREGYDTQMDAERERRNIALSHNERPRPQAFIG
jgi:hypothetical protein